MKNLLLLLALLRGASALAGAPVANNDLRTTPSNTMVTFSVTANDVAAAGSSLDLATVDLDPGTVGRQTSRVVSGQGSYAVDDAGNLSFTPGSNYTGSSQVMYTVRDNAGLTSNTATVTVRVGPVAVVDAASTARNAAVTVNVLANDSDVDGLAAATLDLNPGVAGRQTSFTVTGGGFTCDNAGNVTFTPTTPYSVGLMAVVQYTVEDALGAVSNVSTYTATTVNVAPVAVADFMNTPSNTVVTFSITANDSDSDGTLVLSSVDLDPTTAGRQASRAVSGQGSYAVDNAGNITFTPNLNYTGTSSVPYNVTDNDGTVSNTALVTVRVGPLTVNDAAGTTPTTNVTANVLANDNDVDGIAVGTVDLDPATAGRQTAFTVTGRATFTADNAGNVTFQPLAGYIGSTGVSYTVQDQTGATSNVSTFTVTTSSSSPIASNDVGLTAPNVTAALPVNVLVAVTANDVDPGGNLAANTIDLDPTVLGTQTSRTIAGQGTFTTQPVGTGAGQVPAGSVKFTPELNFTGSGVVQYTVQNSSGSVSNAATLTVRVGPLAVLDGVNVLSSAPTTFSILANDNDVDGLAVGSVDLDPATAGQQQTRTVASRGTFTLDPATGLITFTPSTPYTAGLTATISYIVRDTYGAPSNPVNLTITTANTAPVANPDVAYALPGQTVVFSVTANDTDADGTVSANTVDLDPGTSGIQTTFVYVVGGVTYGTFSVSGTGGNVQWAPQGGAASTYTGTATISYVVNDNSGATSNAASITLRVGPRALADAATTITNSAVAVNILANDVDEDGLDLTSVDLNPGLAGVQTSYTVTGGSFVVDNTGQVVFTPDAGFIGTVTMTYTVLDLTGAISGVGTLTVTVNAPNLPPSALADDVQTPPGVSITFSVTANDSDPDGSINVARVDLDPSTAGVRDVTRTITGVGTFSVDNLGNVTFVPVAGFTGTASISYTVEDNLGLASNAAPLTVRVGPLAGADVFYGLPGSDATGNVTTNDSDTNGLDLATVDLNTALAGIQNTFTVTGQGTFAVDAGGVVTFTPVAGFTGTCTISYTINDQTGATSGSASLTVRVGPQTADESVTTFQGVATSLNVLTTDTDTDGLNVASVSLDPGNPVRQTSRTLAGQGTFAVNNAGLVAFTPVAAFIGSSSITYTVLDNTGAVSTVGTFTVNVVLNQNPVAVADSAYTVPNAAVTFDITGNDYDPDGTINPGSIDLDPATAGVQTSRTVAGQGTWTTVGVAAGSVKFTPLNNYTGTSTISYVVKDAIGALSNSAMLRVRIGPRAINDQTQTAPGASVNINVPANDTDANGLDLTTVDLNPGLAGIQRGPVTTPLGTFTANATTGMVTFVPSSPTATGTATLTYTITDQTGAVSNVATITVNIVADGPPLAVDDEAFTPYTTAVTFSLTGNDVPPSGGSGINQASVVLTGSTAGVLVVAGEGTYTTVGVAAGSVRFTPVAGFTGNSTATYTVKDNKTPTPRTSNAATITVHVGPQAVADAASGPKNVPTTGIDILGNDVDVDGLDAATVDLNPGVAGIQTSYTAVVGGVTRGTFTVNAAGFVTFAPAGGTTGAVTLNYTVRDNTGATSSVGVLTFTVLNASAPVAVNDLQTTRPNTNAMFNVVSNDTDADGNATIVATSVDLDPATAGQQTSFSVPGKGDFSVDNAGVVTFVPALNYTGLTSINYAVQDLTGYTSVVAQAANGGVIAVNVGPLSGDDASSTRYNVAKSVTVTTNDSDANGLNGATLDLDPVTAGRQTSLNAFVGAVQVGTWSVNNGGSVTFTPLAGAHTLGVATLTYVISDNAAAATAVQPGPAVGNVATYSLTLTSAAPVAVNDVKLAAPNAATSFSVTANDTDPDGSNATTINAATVDLNLALAGRQQTLTVTGGSFAVNSAGVVTFTPTAGFTGTATTTYTVNDTTRITSNAATIRVELGPITADDAAFVLPNTNRAITVLTNDVDASGLNANSVDLDPITAGRQTSFAVSGKGTFSVNGAGTVTFAPALNYTGTATASYTVNDVNGAPSLVANINVVVGPRALADAITAPYSGSPNFSLTANDVDVDGLDLTSLDLDPNTAGRQTSRTVAGRGTFTLSPANDGTVTFVPVTGYVGTTSITYTVLDVLGAISNAGTVTVTTTNTAPVAVNDVARTRPNTAVTFSASANDSDLENELRPATLDLNPSVGGRQTSLVVNGQGTFALTAANDGTVTFTPAANFTGSSSITYYLQDAKNAYSNVATLTAHVGPLTVNDGATRLSNAAVSVPVLDNDTDFNGIDATTVDLDPTVAGIQTTALGLGGNFAVNGAGIITFTPVAPFTGGLVSTVNYTVLDITGAPSNVAMLTIVATNTPPTPADDAAVTAANTAVSFNVTGNDTDPDGVVDVATVDLNATVGGRQTSRTVFGEGSYTVDNAGVVTFTPVLNYTSIATLQYLVSDNNGATATTPATIRVRVGPLTVNDAATTPSNQAVTLNLVANDIDTDGVDPATVDLDPSTAGRQTSRTVVVGGATYGTFALPVANNGTVVFTPAAPYGSGRTAAITYALFDVTGAPSTVATITVTTVNAPPQTVLDDVAMPPNNTVTFNVLGNDFDPDNNIVPATLDLDPSTAARDVVRIINGEGRYSVDNGGNVTFVPFTNYTNTSHVTYTVQDEAGAISAPGTIQVRVGPLTVNDAAITPADTPITYNILGNDIDVNGLDPTTLDLDPYTAGQQTTTVVARGTFVLHSAMDGRVIFTPTAPFRRDQQAVTSYQLRDLTGAPSVIATYTVTTDTPLPVELVAFEAKASGADARLSWRTASEKNNDHFVVERSFNGLDFAPLGRVAGQGSTARPTTYAYNDAHIGPRAQGRPLYYRLRQVDQDGQESFSPVRVVSFSNVAEAAPVVALWPRPATATATLDLSQLPTEFYDVRVLDATGRQVLAQRLPGGAAHALDVQALPVGSYVVRVQGPGGSWQQRLLKE